ncbi:hypothetical protein [Pseudoalteromonas rubra]|nr:hypothetical protein [Pseudoalteromonas rubra]
MNKTKSFTPKTIDALEVKSVKGAGLIEDVPFFLGLIFPNNNANN